MADAVMGGPARPPGTRRGIVKTTLAILVMVGLLAALGAMQVLHDGQRRAGFHEALERLVSERTLVQRVHSLLLQAESAQRVLIITGREDFLARYESAVTALPGEIRSLLGLPMDELQRERALRLQELSTNRIRYLADGIEQRRTAASGTVSDMLAWQEGHHAREELRALVDEMMDAQARGIEQVSHAARRHAATAQVVAISLIGSILAAVILASLLGATYLERRRRAELDLRGARREAERALSRAESASRSKSDFLASMSHEVRTPLSGILGYADLLLEEDLSPPHRRYVERIQVAGISLLTVVNEVLDFSGIEAGAIRLEPHPFSVPGLMDSVVSILGTLAERKGLAINVKIASEARLAVVGDEARLRQVLLNLVNNAIKFTERGHVDLCVDVAEGRTETAQLRFTVRDTGIGIAATEQGALFKRFSQIGAASRRYGSTGLGLAICKRLVDLMDGRIGVDSQEGRGATFWFEVRLGLAAEAALQQADSDGIVPRARRRILLVEDLEQNRDVAVAMLEAAGQEVTAVAGGGDAVAAAQLSLYDLVLMDIQMPGMNGLEAATRIRALPAPNGHVPIVALTANVLPQQIAEYKSVGMDDHLSKPFKRSQLLAAVARWTQIDTSPRAVSGGAATPAMCSETMRELLRMMGREWVESRLADLRSRLDDTFGGSEFLCFQPDRIAQQAHALVSLSAMMGFLSFSKLCGGLERAALYGGNVERSFRLAKEQAATLSRHIDALLREPELRADRQACPEGSAAEFSG